MTDPHPGQPPRVLWAFWAASAAAALGGVAPLALAGTHGRVDGVIFPFWFAALALAVCASIHHRGRPIATGLYFVAGLAIVYGLLELVAIPLRLTVLGVCPPAPATCASGLERPLTDAENTGLGVAAALGIIAVFLGFFGLVVLFRRFTRVSAAPAATAPPVRRIPPVRAPAAQAAGAAPELPAPEAAPELPAPEHAPELPAPEADPELPAPEADPELPSHEPDPELPAHEPDPELPAPAGEQRPELPPPAEP